MSQDATRDKERPEIGPLDGERTDRAIGRALAESAAALEEDGEQLDLLEPAAMLPEWLPAGKAGALAAQLEEGRARRGRPKGARNLVGQAFWQYVRSQGYPDPALAALEMIQLGAPGMAVAMGVKPEKAAELWVSLVKGMLDKRLPSLAALQVSGDKGTGVNVAFNFGAPEGGFPQAGDGSLRLEGTVGNQAVSGDAPAELEAESWKGEPSA